MKRGINLKLPKKKSSEFGKKFLYTSIAIFGITIVLGISIVGYNLYLETKKSSLQAERESLLSQIVSQNAKIYKLNDTHIRLSNIQSIVTGRSRAIDRIDLVAGLIPENSEINNLESDGTSVISAINSPDLGSINDLLEEKLVAFSRDKEKQVKLIDMQSLTLNTEDKVYVLNFNVGF